MSEKIFALPGETRIVCDGKPIEGGRLWRTEARDSGLPNETLFHVLYAMESEACAIAHLEQRRDQVTERADLQSQIDGYSFYANPHCSNAELDALPKRGQMALVVWRDGTNLHKLCCGIACSGSNLTVPEEHEAARKRALERCAELTMKDFSGFPG